MIRIKRFRSNVYAHLVMIRTPTPCPAVDAHFLFPGADQDRRVD